MGYRKCLRALASLLGVALAGTSASGASAAAPPHNSCFVDVAPTAGDQPMALNVKFTCAVAGPLTLRANSRQSASFIGKVADAAGQEIEASNRLWKFPANASGIVEARYRFELDAYLDETNSETVGMRRGTVRALLLEGWLMQPIVDDNGVPLAIAVDLPPGHNFASGLKLRDGRYVLDDTPVRFAGYSVFGTFKPLVVPVPPPPGSAAKNTHIELVILDGQYAATPQQYAEWVQQSARAIATYFDGFSVPNSLIVVFPTRGRGIQFGRVVPGGGITMMLRAGVDEKARDLYYAWVLIHEMIHTAAPFVDGRGSWLMEGMATYIEPIIRSRVGWKSEDDVWREWIDNMPRGVSALAQNGLANDTGRNANYWGGALFMLLADIDMRRASANKYGLEDCLRAILRGGGNATTRVSVDRMLSACDTAVGGSTMQDLARRHVYKATPFDLDALWRDLGVALVDGRIVYNDKAPLAAIRKTIVPGTRGPSLIPIVPG